MADNKWTDGLAARLKPSEGEPKQERPSEAERPAWARALADRATGQPRDEETLEAAHRAARRPRTEFERKMLERLGHGEEPPPAA
ncbi:hypothetical protein [Streptomyces mirabilis]|uniref:hypothetical protein n=1 Tax=Streptomyces mirabilis TaxID=68239 RepID=UPI0033D8EA3C